MKPVTPLSGLKQSVYVSAATKLPAAAIAGTIESFSSLFLVEGFLDVNLSIHGTIFTTYKVASLLFFHSLHLRIYRLKRPCTVQPYGTSDKFCI